MNPFELRQIKLFKHTMVIKCWKLLAVWLRINHSLLDLLWGKQQERVWNVYKHLQGAVPWH